MHIGLLTCLLFGSPLNGEEGDDAAIVSAYAPEPVTDDDFTELKANSPFLRPLDLSKSLVLKGLARIDGDLIATLYDREKDETRVVSRSTNSQGWRLMGIEGDTADLGTVTAQISVAGGEIVAIRFDQKQLNPGEGGPGPMPRLSPEQARRVAEQAKNFRRGISGDGYRGPPPRELADKLSRLSEDQRARLIYEIGEMRQRGVSSEERRRAFNNMVDRALRQGR